MKKKEIIAIEEHYIDQILYKEKFENTKPSSLEKKLLDIGQDRINHMNDSGIDIQILSFLGSDFLLTLRHLLEIHHRKNQT